MMRLRLLVIKAELKRWIALVQRYPISYVSSAIALYLIFLGMYFSSGAAKHGDPQLMADALVGYLMWMFVFSAIGDLSSSIADEALTGTYEQLCLHPVGNIWILVCRSVTRVFDSLIMVSINLCLITLTTGIRLALDPLPCLLVLILCIAGLYGFGFLLASLTLIFKRIGPISQVIQFVFLFLTGAVIPLDTFPAVVKVIGNLLPLTWGIQAMKMIVSQQIGLMELVGSPVFLNLLLNSAIYIILGLTIFKWADSYARQQGILGQY